MIALFRKFAGCAMTCGLLIGLGTAAARADDGDGNDWPMFGHDSQGTRYNASENKLGKFERLQAEGPLAAAHAGGGPRHAGRRRRHGLRRRRRGQFLRDRCRQRQAPLEDDDRRGRLHGQPDRPPGPGRDRRSGDRHHLRAGHRQRPRPLADPAECIRPAGDLGIGRRGRQVCRHRRRIERRGTTAAVPLERVARFARSQ